MGYIIGSVIVLAAIGMVVYGYSNRFDRGGPILFFGLTILSTILALLLTPLFSKLVLLLLRAIGISAHTDNADSLHTILSALLTFLSYRFCRRVCKKK